MRNRLTFPLLLLVVVPATVFAAAGIYFAHHSRSGLIPELHREAARGAAEYLRYYRAQLRDSVDGSFQELGPRLARLGFRRYTVYGPRGTVIENHPPGAATLPTQPPTPRSQPLLAAARRGTAVIDLVMIEGTPRWLGYAVRGDTLAVFMGLPASEPIAEFRSASGFETAMYLDGKRVVATGPWPERLRAGLADSLVDLDRPLRSRVNGQGIAVAPLKDFDDWSTIGAIAVRASEDAPTIPELPLAPSLAMALAALWLIGTVLWSLGRSTSNEAGDHVSPRQLRLGFTAALIPPAIAAAWLAASDAHLSARATDALLDLGSRLVTIVVQDNAPAAASDAPPALTARQLAELTGADVAWLRGDSIIDTHGAEIRGRRLTAGAAPRNRMRIDESVRAYRAIDLADGSRLFLFRTPLEDARKGALFWLAGLYGLLTVSVLIFASLASAGESRLALREATAGWAFVSPALLLLLVFSAAPLVFAFYLSFHQWNLLEPAKPFIGLTHYLELAGDGLFWNAAKNTALYSLYVPVSMALALGVAILLNRTSRGVALLRAVFFLPYVTSFVAISIVWQWMYDPEFGLFNWALGLVGLGPLPWLSSPQTALISLMGLAIWIHIGFQMVIFLAGLQAIPNELYEAALVDGAGPWRRFWKITLPLLKPTTFFILVTSIIGSFQVFTFVYVMTEGGPLHATDVIVYHIYQNAWQFLRMGYASAMSWILFAVILVITLLQFRFLGRRVTPT